MLYYNQIHNYGKDLPIQASSIGYYPPPDPPNKLSPNQKMLIGSVIALGVYSQASPKVKKIMERRAVIYGVGIGVLVSAIYVLNP